MVWKLLCGTRKGSDMASLWRSIFSSCCHILLLWVALESQASVSCALEIQWSINHWVQWSDSFPGGPAVNQLLENQWFISCSIEAWWIISHPGFWRSSCSMVCQPSWRSGSLVVHQPSKKSISPSAILDCGDSEVFQPSWRPGIVNQGLQYFRVVSKIWLPICSIQRDNVVVHWGSAEREREKTFHAWWMRSKTEPPQRSKGPVPGLTEREGLQWLNIEINNGETNKKG